MPVSKKAAVPRERMRVPGPDRAVVAALDELFGGRKDLRKGAMFGCPGYFLGTKAVACVFGNELCLTVPAERVDQLVASPGYRRFEARGRAMTGWVLVDQERIAALDPDAELLEAAIGYARSKALKPPNEAKARSKPITEPVIKKATKTVSKTVTKRATKTASKAPVSRKR